MLAGHMSHANCLLEEMKVDIRHAHHIDVSMIELGSALSSRPPLSLACAYYSLPSIAPGLQRVRFRLKTSIRGSRGAFGEIRVEMLKEVE